MPLHGGGGGKGRWEDRVGKPVGTPNGLTGHTPDPPHTPHTQQSEHMAMTTTTTTELTAILVNSGMDPADSALVSQACTDTTIGITTMASVLGYDAGVLATIGTPSFTTAMRDLITAVKAVDGSCLATTVQQGQFTTAIRKMVKEGEAQEAAQLRSIGLGAAPPSNTVVLGNDGEQVIKREEIERRRNLDAAIGGYWHLTDATPSAKMVSFFSKGLGENPPTLRLFPLGSACSDFNARQLKKPQSGMERLAGEPEDQFDLRGDNPNSKGRFIHALVLVGNAIAVAASEHIPTSKQADYYDLNSGQVQHKGKTAYVYGTRYVTELLLMTALVEGGKSEPDQLNRGYESVMKAAARYIGARYLVNSAFAKAVHEEKADWRPQRREVTHTPHTPGNGGGGGGRGSGATEKARQI